MPSDYRAAILVELAAIKTAVDVSQYRQAIERSAQALKGLLQLRDRLNRSRLEYFLEVLYPTRSSRNKEVDWRQRPDDLSTRVQLRKMIEAWKGMVNRE